MRLFDDRRTTLRCFSSEVVLATFALEFLLAVYVWWRYRLTVFGRLSAIFLLLLAGFQLSEYAICRGADPALWTRIGFVCTAFLPILGIDFVTRLRRMKYSMVWGYALAGAFSVVMLLYPGLFGAAECTGRFVAFDTTGIGFDILYATYYLATLFLGIGLAWQGLKQPGANRKALIWILIGYAAFMLPTFAVYFLASFGNASVASVLCGFAALMAVILVWRILPLAHRRG
ncbi:hypothetical protein EDM68_03165 [Candidatus Uhrbacteria bacterium]|nr:MAG: hypothetical protein EDM68_03165 [Candidatus Uhrbacteria bacterium]